ARAGTPRRSAMRCQRRSRDADTPQMRATSARLKELTPVRAYTGAGRPAQLFALPAGAARLRRGAARDAGIPADQEAQPPARPAARVADADPRRRRDARVGERKRAALLDPELGGAAQVAAVAREVDAERPRETPGPRAELLRAPRRGPAREHRLDPLR